jgi:hypothetical protein
VVAIGVWRIRPAEKPPERAAAAKIGGPTKPERPVGTNVAARKRLRPKKKLEAAEPLRVKLFTSDPDVVIYWIVDKKEGYE